MMIKAVLFDVDGTLVDSVDLHAKAWVDTFREFGREVAFEEVRGQIGKGGDELMPVFLSPEDVEAKGKEIERRRSEIFRERYLPQVKAFEGAHELLRHVDAKGLRVALASSATTEEVAALKRIIGLEENDLDAETSADDAQRSKPHADTFLAALERLPGVGPDEAIVVGDTPYDMEAAARAGIQAIGMLCGGFSEESLRTPNCIGIYRDPKHLLEDYELSPLGAGGMPD